MKPNSFKDLEYMKNLNRVAIAVSAALLTSAAGAVDFNGYMRAGTGLSGNNGENISFEKNKIGRLGNENDLYAEFGFRQELPKITGMEDQKWVVDAMIAQGSSGNNGWEDGGVNVAQFNVQATGLFASDKEATLWAGKRYYQRKDIHISDFYFLNTSGGAGGGIENVSVGPGKLSAAWMLDDGSQKSTTTKQEYQWVDADNDPSTPPVWQQVDVVTEKSDKKKRKFGWSSIFPISILKEFFILFKTEISILDGIRILQEENKEIENRINEAEGRIGTLAEKIAHMSGQINTMVELLESKIKDQVEIEVRNRMDKTGR